MKRKLIAVVFLLSLYSCGDKAATGTKGLEEKPAAKQWEPPAAGSIVDKMEQRITEDNLNEVYFRVSIISTDSSKSGHYVLKLEHGYNVNDVPVSLPLWTDNVVLKPMLQRGTGKYHCLVGFDASDNKFHELYEVTVVNESIKFKQTRGYYQSTGTP
jgi:hypothetical protein